MSVIDETLSAWKFLSYGLLTSTVAAVFLTAVALVASLSRKRTARQRLQLQAIKGGLLAAAIGFLAWVVGYMTGISRDPAVADVVLAVLGSIGAVAGFVSLRFGHSLQVGMIMFSFAISLFVGSSIGAKIRQQHEHADLGIPPLDFLKREARRENDIKRYRETLELPWPPMAYPNK